jgi:hypothetical protein
MSFDDSEIAYLQSQSLARFATLGKVERVGMIGPGLFLRITPVVSWSWNMAGEPAGDTWYPSRKSEHTAPEAE